MVHREQHYTGLARTKRSVVSQLDFYQFLVSREAVDTVSNQNVEEARVLLEEEAPYHVLLVAVTLVCYVVAH